MASKKTERNKKYIDKTRAKCKEYLGGVCAKCGISENLEFDHIDPSTKLFTITSKINCSFETLKFELDKCQLLCRKCHITKTKENKENTGGGWNKWNEIIHGTTTGYNKYKCRCDHCKLAKKLSRQKGSFSCSNPVNL